MITTKLEELIWQGKARSRTWCIGGAGVSRIPVQKNSFIVITDILWTPFNDEKLQSGVDIITHINTYNLRMIHSMLLYTSKSKQLFNFRDQLDVKPTPDWLTDGGKSYISTSAPYNVPCYLVFDENVRVNIMCVDNAPYLWSGNDFTAMAPTSDELNIEQGYMTAGEPNAMPTQRQFTFNSNGANDSTIYPAADQLPPAPATAASASYQYQGKSSGGRGLFDVVSFSISQSSGINTPLVTFQYVEIFGAVPKEMRPALT